MAANGGSLLTISGAVIVSVSLSLGAAVYSNGYQDATVATMEKRVDKLSGTPERLSAIETTLKDINRRLARMEDRIDLALGEHGK